MILIWLLHVPYFNTIRHFSYYSNKIIDVHIVHVWLLYVRYMRQYVSCTVSKKILWFWCFKCFWILSFSLFMRALYSGVFLDQSLFLNNRRRYFNETNTDVSCFSFLFYCFDNHRQLLIYLPFNLQRLPSTYLNFYLYFTKLNETLM